MKRAVKRIAVIVLALWMFLLLWACALIGGSDEPTYIFKPGSTVNPESFDKMTVEEMEEMIQSIERFLSDRKSGSLPDSERSSLVAQLKELNILLEREREVCDPDAA